MLFLRALIAFLALPGTVAFLAPALLLGSIETRTAHGEGIAVFIAGSLVLLWCVRDFYIAGKGTLAPWDPPRHLVNVGLYRFSRNPMYVGVLIILLGWTLTFRARSVLIYTGVVALLFHLRVLLYEEPWLARTFPNDWPRFKSRVPRWLFPVPRADRR
ncbi:MAG TPA: isoprenylcysteine carboxylmethyltransferase family protein [Vicinamibacterales bacterium]|nr:isoprenylcysteine carboxylmethyltransferase family protein [Vicinamibacterales bacterium]